KKKTPNESIRDYVNLDFVFQLRFKRVKNRSDNSTRPPESNGRIGPAERRKLKLSATCATPNELGEETFPTKRRVKVRVNKTVRLMVPQNEGKRTLRVFRRQL
uniref:Uncharacterized protein n=1 Tax=Anopheles dirus TaxID=7168 RepID=A0A182N7Y5_9DIPT